MKVLRVLLSVVMLFGFVGVAMAADMGPTSNKPCPIVSRTGTGKLTSVTGAAGSVGTAVSANDARVGGYVVNISTNYLRCSLTSATTTGIDAAYFYLAPLGTANDSDRFFFNHDGIVYKGAFYFYAVQTDLSTKGAASASTLELK